MGLGRSKGVAVAYCWLMLAGAAEPSHRETGFNGAVVDETPLRMEIRTQLDFSRATTGGTGTGQISINPDNGTRSVAGDVVDLGGSAIAGSVILTGEPGRAVRIDMPSTIRMTSSTGSAIQINNLRTNLPPQARLDHFGRLEFSFGGDLLINGSVAGAFRGRIPITAEYE
jgi:hypothetical protein